MKVFKKSSHCQDGSCVGVAVDDDEVAVRDEKNPSHGHLVVSRRAFVAFIDGIRVNRFVEAA